MLHHIRFVGARLGNAAVEVLRERKKGTSDEIVEALNGGEFRFRTSTPKREVHAALMRQPLVKRKGETWVYQTPAAQSAPKLPAILAKEVAA